MGFATSAVEPGGFSRKFQSSAAGPRRHEQGANMGQPVVHFEIVGQDAKKLQSYYSELFGWQINADNPMGYGIVDREQNVNADGVGIGGGVGGTPEGYDGHVTFYVEVPDVEAALAKAKSLGGTRMMGPDKVMEGIEIGLFQDPEGHTVGLIKS
jgi:predicted enzyme related to lactoylglutathione lyase